MNTTFPSGLASHINEKGTELLKLVKSDMRESKRSSNVTSDSHRIFPQFKGPEPIVKDDRMYSVDFKDRITAAYFRSGDDFLGVNSEDYGVFAGLLSQLRKRRSDIPRVSEKRLADMILFWLRDKHADKTEIDLAAHLTQSYDSAVSSHTIHVIISNLIIQKRFRLGGVHFDYYKAEDFDNLAPLLNGTGHYTAEQVTKLIGELKEEYQGRVYGEVVSVGDERGAEEVAHEEISDALDILRVFTPTAMYPDYPTKISIEGFGPLTSRTLIWDRAPTIVETLQQSRNDSYVITESTLVFLRKNGLDDLDKLLMESDNEFSNTVRTTIHHFSLAVQSSDFEMKLLHLCIALESLFLANEKESVQISLSLRLAFLIGFGLKRRRAIVDLITVVYSARSKFVHHGATGVIQLEELQELSQVLFEAIVVASKNRARYSTKALFIEFLNRRILS